MISPLQVTAPLAVRFVPDELTWTPPREPLTEHFMSTSMLDLKHAWKVRDTCKVSDCRPLNLCQKQQEANKGKERERERERERDWPQEEGKKARCLTCGTVCYSECGLIDARWHAGTRSDPSPQLEMPRMLGVLNALPPWVAGPMAGAKYGARLNNDRGDWPEQPPDSLCARNTPELRRRRLSGELRAPWRLS